ncbi:NlpC/P60 family protein [Micromonospora rhizosphaerae]|uniref:NlpC/P60 family protein n=1 Tax=Micromonospora rhizosphaerae TaxID=568872 RepID=A0A1C6RIM1_9ACTN|nr:NlpC/P60 family protein [Micromonospora rhizosphaerae]
MVSPVLRPALWSALLGAVAAAALAAPAWAEPPLPNTVPDTGSRPAPAAGWRLPGSVPGLPGTAVPGAPGTASANPVGGPLIAQIEALDAQVGLLADQLLQLRDQRTEAQSQLALAAGELKRADEALATAQAGADAAAAEAVKAAAALPPGEFGEDLHDLSMLQRITRGDKAEGATTAAAGELARARAAEQIAREAYAAAESRARNADEQYAAVEKAHHEQEARLLKLRRDNAAQLLEAERREEAAEQLLGRSYVGNQSVSGLVADPRALAAVRYALAQLGDPYLWAAEGPDRFDCSGLVLASYLSAGYRDLPRVSRDQYYATRSRTVDPNFLLPGDLLFFASGSSWTTIHHVAMYIGGGKMVEAPRSGDVVKISTVRWSRLYAATRVIGAMPAPARPVPAPTRTTTQPRPTPTPTRTATPKPTRTPTPTPTTTTPSPTTSPSTSPSPTPSPTTPPPTTSAPETTSPAETSEPSPTTSSSTSEQASASASAGG